MTRQSITEDTPIKIRLAVFWSLLGAAAVAGAGYAVAQYQINELQETVSANETSQGLDHDLLVRIDERTAAISADQQKILDRLMPVVRITSNEAAR